MRSSKALFTRHRGWEYADIADAIARRKTTGRL